MQPDRAALQSTLPPLACSSEGEGPSLLLLHGGAGSRTHWCRNIPALARHFTVHAFDLPGYGASPNVPKTLTPDDYLDWVADAAADLDDRIDIAGFSFGGVVAAGIAARLGRKVRRLSLIGPGGFGNPVGRSIPLRRMPGPDAGEAERRLVIAYNLGQWMLSRAPEPSDPVIDLQWDNIRRTRFDSRTVSLRESITADLSRATCPVQLIWGEKDPLAYPSIAARTALCQAVRPDIRVSIVPQAGHWAQFEAADPVNSLLIAFHAEETLA
ncbi:alpha/beta fold hydrolase [Rhodoligotrophos ferricapiens]|uniref:alpha/beta fold hydrolase n=1 Tax=Rhodoligotrophos ferricapiens TaxID=3069264 RepID=UPI00315CF32B